MDFEKLGAFYLGKKYDMNKKKLVHEDTPVIFYTRWAMSYLRGPLTRTQISKLMKDRKPDKMELMRIGLQFKKLQACSLYLSRFIS